MLFLNSPRNPLFKAVLTFFWQLAEIRMLTSEQWKSRRNHEGHGFVVGGNTSHPQNHRSCPLSITAQLYPIVSISPPIPNMQISIGAQPNQMRRWGGPSILQGVLIPENQLLIVEIVHCDVTNWVWGVHF